jgi:hypothetical protein
MEVCMGNNGGLDDDLANDGGMANNGGDFDGFNFDRAYAE